MSYPIGKLVKWKRRRGIGHASGKVYEDHSDEGYLIVRYSVCGSMNSQKNLRVDLERLIDE